MDNIITVKTQAEFDALPAKFEEFTYIYIQNNAADGRIVISRRTGNASVKAMDNASVKAMDNASVKAMDNVSVEAWGNASVEAWGNASVEAWGNVSVYAKDNASVKARGNASVEAWGNASVKARDNASVEAWGNASVEARGNASVKARGNASVEAWDNASVGAWDNASVKARDNASVEAWGNASVEARGNASVVARDNASVQAWDNASVEAWDNAEVHLYSVSASVVLFMYSVCWDIAKGKITKKSKTATIIQPNKSEGTEGTKGWLESQAIKQNKNKQVVLFKRVSSDWKTQEHTANETVWQPNTTLEHANWEPDKNECGEGKFHACSRPYFCDQFRSVKDDKYVAIQVSVQDLYAWPNPAYPHKVAFRKGKVLYQCDKFGKKIGASISS